MKKIIVVTIVALAVIPVAMAETKPAKKPEKRLKDLFRGFYGKFGQKSTTKVKIVSGPTDVKMRNGRVPGKVWMATSGEFRFKITIQNSTGVKLEKVVQRLQKLPAPYMRACQVVSDKTEDGIAIYANLGGASAHGGQSYINLIPNASALVIAHEAGHTLEQKARNSDPKVLDQWGEAIKADKVSVSGYGDKVRHEDLGEFAQVYAVCLDAGAEQLARLKKLSPARFALWEKILAPPSAAQPGAITHKIRSKYLGNVETTIHVLLPSKFDRKKRYKVLYILPVINGETSGKPRWGKPLAVAGEHKFADKYNVICVMATFDRGTLYVNHPTDKTMQHEDYFVKDVVPLIDKKYPTLAEPRGRLLTGFCASGNGAMWLMLRHLDMFGKAAAWDTWLDIKKMHPPDKKQFGTEKNFQQNCIMNLVDKHAKTLKGGPTRIIMMAYRNNRDGHFSVNRFHDKLFDLGIPHVFEYHAKEKHRWDSGWLPRAVGYLFMEDFSNGPKPAGR